jgi:hypothetical protein
MSQTTQPQTAQTAATPNADFNPAWLPRFINAFGNPGLATLAFWQGSLFAEKIRDEQESFPFLELTGEPASGKSTVTEFLWKMVGKRDYAGFCFELATLAAIRRQLNSATLPVVGIDSDYDTRFDFEKYKSLYNGRVPFLCAKPNHSDELEDQIKFRGTLMIQQNEKVSGSKALESRIVSVRMDRRHHNRATFTTARWCRCTTSANLAGFLDLSMKNERQILKTYFNVFADLESAFVARGIRNDRVMKNHAQIVACAYALRVLFTNLGNDVLQAFTNYMINEAVICEDLLNEA